jgi:pimeloyl-ACP methyl ester carboxylesterase
MEALVPPDTRWENRVAARIALRVGAYRPGRAAARLTCPALFCVCDDDSLAPAEITVKHASRAQRGEIKRYPVGHFEIYVGDVWERAVTDQTEFLVRHLDAHAESLKPKPKATGKAKAKSASAS